MSESKFKVFLITPKVSSYPTKLIYSNSEEEARKCIGSTLATKTIDGLPLLNNDPYINANFSEVIVEMLEHMNNVLLCKYNGKRYYLYKNKPENITED